MKINEQSRILKRIEAALSSTMQSPVKPDSYAWTTIGLADYAKTVARYGRLSTSSHVSVQTAIASSIQELSM